MIHGEIEEALQKEFRRVAEAARDGIKTGKTGGWYVFGGCLPRAGITCAMISPEDLSARTVTISYPYMFKGGCQEINFSAAVRNGESEEVERQIEIFAESGAKLMTYVIADCVSRLLKAGIDPWVLKSLVDLSVVQDVMES